MNLIAKKEPNWLFLFFILKIIPYHCNNTNSNIASMKKSILLIDDDEIILMLVKKTLKDNGYKVYTAISGEIGIERLKNSNIDLIITDYDIPGGMSGIEILKYIKSNYVIPVIMFTGYDEVPLIIKSMQLGACDYIEKPVHSEQLLESVKNVLSDGSCAKEKIKNPEIIENSTMTENFLISGREGTAKKLISRINYHKDIELLPMCDLRKKKITDMILSFSILLLSAPFLFVIALLIKLTSKGPIIFKQKRIGLHGKEFTLYKFRTMVSDAEDIKKDLMKLNEADGPVFKIKKDPRITNIGSFLRKTGIDEFPQFLNVLKGDMSIIGPRPSLEEEIKKYKKKYFLRLLTKPGITCLWQIQKNRNDIKFDDWMQLDMDYINNWSITQDIKIFFKTFFTVLYGRGQ